MAPKQRPKQYKRWLDASLEEPIPDRTKRRKESGREEHNEAMEVMDPQCVPRQNPDFQHPIHDPDDPVASAGPSMGEQDDNHQESPPSTPSSITSDNATRSQPSRTTWTRKDPEFHHCFRDPDELLDTVGSSMDEQTRDAEGNDDYTTDETNDDERPLSPWSSSDGENSEEEMEDSEEEEEEEEEEEVGQGGDNTEGPRSIEPVNLTHNKLHKKLQEEFQSIISNPVAASRGEVLLSALELSKLHAMPHDVHANMMKLINCLFDVNVVPDSRHLLDKLYISPNIIKYHFYCEHCRENLAGLTLQTKHNVKCSNIECEHENNVKKLSQNYFYCVSVDILSQLQILFESENVFEALKSPAELVRENINEMIDLHGGYMYKSFAASLDYSRPAKYLSFTLSADGTPLFKAGCEVWPIFLSVNELPPNIRMKKLILAGFWFGGKKPNFASFFEVLVSEMKIFSCQGFFLQLHGAKFLFYAYIIACCVDSGARGSVQEVHQHNGAYGCSWCLHPGVRVGVSNNARMYPLLPYEPQLRTKEEVLADGKKAIDENESHVNGVTGVSLLVTLPKFDIVKSMIVDSLHAKWLGVARQFAKLWFGTEGIDKWITPQRPKGVNPPYYVGLPANIKKIDKRISKVKLPVEARRALRGMEDIKYIKARQWENFVLFASVSVMKGFLPAVYLNHWTLFVQGCYLLLQKTLCHEDIDIADGLFQGFVADIEVLYKNGDSSSSPETPCKQMKFNVHLLQHAADNARLWGPDWSINSYSFESGNQDIKKTIKSNKGVAKQVVRQVSQDIARNLMTSFSATPRTQQFVKSIRKKDVSKFLRVGSCVLLDSISDMVPTEEERFILRRSSLDPADFVQCSKVIVNHCVYTIDKYNKASKRNNSVVRLTDRSFAVIKKIIACEASQQVFVLTSVIRVDPYNTAGISHVPIDKRFLYTVLITEEGKHLHKISDIDIVCVSSNVGPLGHTLSPMPNVFTFC